MKLDGIHHISCITGDAAGNVDFYVGTLGLRLAKKTVNQDDPSVYHLFYGDEHGSPGHDLTFFEYPGALRGRAGVRAYGDPSVTAPVVDGVLGFRATGEGSWEVRGSRRGGTYDID